MIFLLRSVAKLQLPQSYAQGQNAVLALFVFGWWATPRHIFLHLGGEKREEGRRGKGGGGWKRRRGCGSVPGTPGNPSRS